MLNRYFAVDLGAESGRCVAGTLEDGVIRLEELHRFPTGGMPLGGTVRWNIFRFYEEILTGLQTYAARFDGAPRSIGVDTWGVDYGLLGPGGELLDLPYSYRDSRTAAVRDEIRGQWDYLYGKTGIQFLDINTLNQLVAERESAGGRLERATGLLFIADLLHHMLGAAPRAEYTAASISLLVDTVERRWDPEIAARFGLPAALCTPLCFAGDTIGSLRDDIADYVGLPRGIPIVAPAVHDTASAAVAIPAAGEDFAFLSSGTWSLVGVELDRPVIGEAARRMNISNSGGALGRSLFLKNVMGLWIIQQCRRRWLRREPDLGYDEIARRAAAAPPFAAFVDPDDDAFFSPPDMPEALCAYLTRTGQAQVAADDVGALARIVYESLAMKYRAVLESIGAAAGKAIRTVHVTGGGSKNALLNGMIADATGLPVVAGPAEGTAMGNLLVQAYGAGALRSLQEIRAVVARSTRPARHNPTDPAAWQREYARFCRLLAVH